MEVIKLLIVGSVASILMTVGILLTFLICLLIAEKIGRFIEWFVGLFTAPFTRKPE